MEDHTIIIMYKLIMHMNEESTFTGIIKFYHGQQCTLYLYYINQ